MTSKVIFRFKSMREPGEVRFSGNFITLGELVKRIVEQRRLSKQQADFDLVVTNDQTKEVYKGDDTRVPKNSRLIINRVPSSYGILARMRGGAQGASRPSTSSTSAATAGVGETDTFGGDVFKEDDDEAMEETGGGNVLNKLAEFAQQRSQQVRQKARQANRQQNPNQMGGRGMPQMQQQNQQKQLEQARRVNIGIPRNYLASVGDQDQSDTSKKASGGGWLVFQSDAAKFQKRVKEQGGVTTKLSDEEVRKRIDPKDIPAEYLCALTGKLLKDCVKLPCCGRHVSSEDIDQALVNNSFVCPLCKTPGINLDKLAPNHEIRRKVQDFILEQKEKLEKNAALEAEKAAAAAEKERQERLMVSKSFNRPDAIVDLATGGVLTEADVDKQRQQQQQNGSDQSKEDPAQGDADGQASPNPVEDSQDNKPAPTSISQYLVRPSQSDPPSSRGSGQPSPRDNDLRERPPSRFDRGRQDWNRNRFRDERRHFNNNDRYDDREYPSGRRYDERDHPPGRRYDERDYSPGRRYDNRDYPPPRRYDDRGAPRRGIHSHPDDRYRRPMEERRSRSPARSLPRSPPPLDRERSPNRREDDDVDNASERDNQSVGSQSQAGSRADSQHRRGNNFNRNRNRNRNRNNRNGNRNRNGGGGNRGNGRNKRGNDGGAGGDGRRGKRQRP